VSRLAPRISGSSPAFAEVSLAEGVDAKLMPTRFTLDRRSWSAGAAGKRADQSWRNRTTAALFPRRPWHDLPVSIEGFPFVW